MGHHGPMTSMGVPRNELPLWDDLQIMVAQRATKPLMENDPVATDLVIGPNANTPLTLKTPLFVSDMSFGALSEEAKVALAKGAERAGTDMVREKLACCPKNRRSTHVIFTNGPAHNLATTNLCSIGYRPSILRGDKVQKPVRAVICPARKIRGKYRRYEAFQLDSPPSLLRRLKT